MESQFHSVSKTQERILEFIQGFVIEHPYPPTIREIQNGCAISSTSVVKYNLHTLEKLGFLRRSDNVSRGIEFIGVHKKTPSLHPNISIPILGYIAAGEPIPVLSSELADSESIDTLEVPLNFIPQRSKTKNIFALRVKGLSMIDALIDDGDLVLIESTPQAPNGTLVVAWLKEENEATLKRFFLEGSMVRLEPANRSMEAIYVRGENLEIKGVVLGVIRGSQNPN